MSTHIRRFGTSLTLFAVAVVLAGYPVAYAAEPTLDEGWQSSGPIEPQWLAADAHGSAALGRTGDVVVIDASGVEQWRRTIITDFAFGPVAVGNGVVVVTISDEGYIAFDRASSATRWKHELPGADGAHVGTTSDGAAAIALIADGVLELVEAATGIVRWSVAFSTAEPIHYSRAWVTGDRVVLTWVDERGSHLRALSSNGGGPLWSYDAAGFSSTPVVSDDAVFFAENVSKDEGKHLVVGEFKSLALSDGDELWTRAMRSRNGYWAGIATAAGERGVAFVDLAGRVTVVNPTTGRARWRMNTRKFQYEAMPSVLGEVFAMTTYGTGIVTAGMAEGQTISTDRIEPGQTVMTIEASAAAGDRLYLLVSWPWGDSEIWMLQAGPA